MATTLRRELITGVQYFVIMFIAATAAMYVRESDRAQAAKEIWERQLADDAPAIGRGEVVVAEASVHTWDVLRNLWEEYYLVWVGMFVGLSVLRLSVVLILSKVGRRMV